MSFTATRALAVAAFAVVVAPAFAADLPTKKVAPQPAVAATPFFDFAFGGKLMSDYILRGVSQSGHKPAVTAYGELRLNPTDWLQAYAGVQGWSVKLPQSPAAEIDLYAGVRPTFGPLSLDLGYVWYAYPGSDRRYWADGAGVTYLAGGAGLTPLMAKDPSFGEFYGKASYTTFNDMLTLGAQAYYAPNWGNVGVKATYAALTAKVNLPNNFYVSGEFGRQYLGKTSATYGSAKLNSYNTWNVGAGYTYKLATLDLRYSATDLSKAECGFNTGDPRSIPVGAVANGRSGWCGQRFVATLSFDISGKDLK